MVKIDWQEYKEYKNYSSKNDNFEILLDFLKSYYSLMNANDIYESLLEDETAKMMLEKRTITSVYELEAYLRK